MDTDSNSTFEKNSHSESVSLYIPHVYPNISRQRFMKCMIGANLGFIQRVDLRPVRDEKDENKILFQRAYVHFGKWNEEDETAKEALNVLRGGKKIKLVYEKPWFWQASISQRERLTPTFNRERTTDVEFFTDDE